MIEFLKNIAWFIVFVLCQVILVLILAASILFVIFSVGYIARLVAEIFTMGFNW